MEGCSAVPSTLAPPGPALFCCSSHQTTEGRTAGPAGRARMCRPDGPPSVSKIPLHLTVRFFSGGLTVHSHPGGLTVRSHPQEVSQSAFTQEISQSAHTHRRSRFTLRPHAHRLLLCLACGPRPRRVAEAPTLQKRTQQPGPAHAADLLPQPEGAQGVSVVGCCKARHSYQRL